MGEQDWEKSCAVVREERKSLCFRVRQDGTVEIRAAAVVFRHVPTVTGDHAVAASFGGCARRRQSAENFRADRHEMAV